MTDEDLENQESELAIRAVDLLDQENLHLTENRNRADKLIRLAWSIEIVLVSVGLSIAFAQAFGGPEETGFLQAMPVFGVFVVLAAVELAKIPAATVVFHARGLARALALGGLMVASLVSFETVFNGIERFVHFTTRPVSEARAEYAELLGEIEQLSSVSLEDELKDDDSDIASVDEERMDVLQRAVAQREKALQIARDNLESPETRELKKQLASVLQQQQEAGDQAGMDWQQYMDDLRSRASDQNLSQETRIYAENLIRQQPTKVTATDRERSKFDAEIAKLNDTIEQSITKPSAEALSNVELKKAERDQAANALANFERTSTVRAEQRIALLRDFQKRKAERSRKIEGLEATANKIKNEVAHKAENSQMHRWASFIFGVDPAEVQDNQAKQIGAIFGVLLGIVAALTGSSVAMYSEWFRVRGVKPVIRIEEIEVEKIVEKEVEVPVEVEVPILRYVYLPVPMGEDAQKTIDDILDALPEEAQKELKLHLAKGADVEEIKEASYARAA